MSLQLHHSWPEALRTSAETGMGYQVLELLRLSPRPEYVIVANGTEVLDVARGRFIVREGIEQRTAMLVSQILRRPPDRAEYQILSRAEAVAARVIHEGERLGGGPASDAEDERSEGEERFLRFSAFPNDIRILPDGSVTPGTYVTMHADGMTFVKTGTDAVRRYALPDPAPAVHRYHLAPPRPITIRRGVVQPAFGEPGGGVEVIFVVGAPAKTKRKQDRIPPR